MSNTRSIRPLPQHTVQRLGSSQTIVDTASVVKELLDNSFDAQATSVAIEVSIDSFSSIQVRDNGHGIEPKDRALACRKSCTNKIREFADLKNLGGDSLGFRGEALGFLAEMSETLEISTRVESEVTGVKIKIGKDGEIISFVNFESVVLIPWMVPDA